MIKILVIDDEDALRETTIAVLRSYGFEALGAANGAEGIELARTTLPDLIICDIRMELVNGYQMLTAIRNDSVTATIPFILMTSNPDRQGMRQGMELGADDFLPKPFSPDELVAAVNARLKKHRLMVEKAETKLQELRTSFVHLLTKFLASQTSCAKIIRICSRKKSQKCRSEYTEMENICRKGGGEWPDNGSGIAC